MVMKSCGNSAMTPPWRSVNSRKYARAACWLVLVAIAAGSTSVCSGQAASSNSQVSPPATKPVASPFRNHPSRIAYRAHMYYAMVWGIDDPRAKLVESGEMIRFTYRVVDAEKAKPLNDKKVEPSLVCPDRSVKLVIPTLEKVGQLRQSAAPEAGRSYWMAFSNKGGIVKRGDRVNIVIGNFHADGIEVE
jgi:hypothetical protein